MRESTPLQKGELIMSMFLRSAIAVVALVGVVSAAASQDYTPYDKEQGIVRFDPDSFWKDLNERAQ
jgi:hypothetical protein